MRVQSFENMEVQYKTENEGLETEDLAERKKLLKKYLHSVIVEGEHSEFDNLEKWIKLNIDRNGLENIYYGKTGYNYGFAEYFLSEKEYQVKLKAIIPYIFTTYPNACPSSLICKSDGYNVTIEYDGFYKNAILFPIE
ncbi:hypothetical protein [Flavobacterium sediminis]|nr:hypothetical protein [Flavobacterium sediminis]